MVKWFIIAAIIAIVVFTPIDDILAFGTFGSKKQPEPFRSPVF